MRVRDYEKLRQHCLAEGIPEEKVIGPDQRPWAQVARNAASECLVGAWDGVVGATVGVAKSAWSLTRSAFNYATSSDFRSQVNDQVRATLGPVASELWYNPTAFNTRVRNALADILWQVVGRPAKEYLLMRFSLEY